MNFESQKNTEESERALGKGVYHTELTGTRDRWGPAQLTHR